MTVENHKVVLIHYTLTDDDGETLDTSDGSEPLAYIHGGGNIVPGLENAISGRSVGDTFKVDVLAEEGYGERHDELVQQVPRSAFSDDDLEVGMAFQAETAGGPHVFLITEVNDDFIVADGNHPLAGQNLHFEIEIVAIRDATEEEMSHGHVHGEGGHHH